MIVKSTHALISNHKKNLLKSKRSQEEVIGFVLIILFVSIIALVFLGLNLRKGGIKQESVEIENFLSSLMRHTSSCQPSRGSFYDIKDLGKACYESEKCLDGRTACEVLGEEVEKIMEKVWPVGENYPNKKYKLELYYKEDEKKEMIKKWEQGEGRCGNQIGAVYNIYKSPGNLVFEMNLCKD